MLRQEGGVLVNARIVGMQSRIVVATAQGFLPADRIGRDLDTLNSIRTQDGVLIRSDPTIRQARHSDSPPVGNRHEEVIIYYRDHSAGGLSASAADASKRNFSGGGLCKRE